MFAERIAVAIDGARTLARLDHLSRLIWQAYAANAVSDEKAQELAERIHVRKGEARAAYVPVGLPPGRPSIFPPRRLQRAPVRSVAIARRRRLAASGPLPPQLAAKFTTGQLAVLRIVGDEVRDKGACSITIAEIAARAGVCRSLAQAAVRAAAELGLVTIEERRRRGEKNLPNVVRIVSREWATWLRRGPDRPSWRIEGAAPGTARRPIGSKKSDPTQYPAIKGSTKRGEGSERSDL